MILTSHNSFKDLGITFNDCFNNHINTICTKAHLIINRLVRCFITNDYIYFLKVYLLYVCPIVESDSSVWNPDNFTCNIENIQIYFTKILFIVTLLNGLMKIELMFSILNFISSHVIS